MLTCVPRGVSRLRVWVNSGVWPYRQSQVCIPRAQEWSTRLDEHLPVTRRCLERCKRLARLMNRYHLELPLPENAVRNLPMCDVDTLTSSGRLYSCAKHLVTESTNSSCVISLLKSCKLRTGDRTDATPLVTRLSYNL